MCLALAIAMATIAIKCGIFLVTTKKTAFQTTIIVRYTGARASVPIAAAVCDHYMYPWITHPNQVHDFYFLIFVTPVSA